MIRLIIALLSLADVAAADTILAARTIPAKTIIAPSDLLLSDDEVPGAASDSASVVGMEARVSLYAGRPIRLADLGQPALIERNQIVQLQYRGNGLVIQTEGRALGRAGPGESIRVMNLNSRATVTAVMGDDGVAYVHR
ncbi:flagellar basal body P-ring formation chaperone FlgA [Yoonia litorea]|uniref:Flagella basal body P-ring formation protein FlgA n=1 Tax=Yoonia litorea TaxID=1123755 RepID=A0A1I6MU61_9RHOB|nr:flagellar basal body P-ring formation chaperone FlgA [Yoonia litorea]SFS19225.1 flagella basal body P-ring formation protein FlgA [Yoonia litorea]